MMVVDKLRFGVNADQACAYSYTQIRTGSPNAVVLYHKPYSFSKNSSAIPVRMRHINYEFFTPKPGQHIRPAEILFYDVHHTPQNIVAGKMSIGVVNKFKVIQIEKNYR